VKTANNRRKAEGRKGVSLTTPDLVLLSLLAEEPMHGYQVDAVLQARNIRDWAAVSRPQIYYSLDKLTAAGLITVVAAAGAGAGPERRVFRTTDRGRRRLAEALEDHRWTTDRSRPAFLTFLALSWQARPGAFERQLERRKAFLEAELTREAATLDDVLHEVGHAHHEAVWMLKLTIGEIRTELQWLDTVRREAGHRAPARPPRRPPPDQPMPGSRPSKRS
jgi:DNA-binding PadR family transcriptional regulator